MERVWKSVELDHSTAQRFKRWLKLHQIYFEASEANNLIHFECLVSADEQFLAESYLNGDTVLTFFTFGSAEIFPYHNTYMIVEDYSEDDCISAFRKVVPDLHKGTINCSFYYDEEHWDNTEMERIYGTPVKTILMK